MEVNRVLVISYPSHNGGQVDFLSYFGSGVKTYNDYKCLKKRKSSDQYQLYIKGKGKGKGKAVPLQAWSGPQGSRNLRFPDFMTTAQDGGKVVSLVHRPPLPPGDTPGTRFC
jgi:hypothetical protein